MYKRKKDKSWDFNGVNTKEFTHCYHTYPAMMIPQVARKLLTEKKPQNIDLKLVFDPYLGSGTTLVECCLLGIDCIGTDINPLAKLISEVKCKVFEINKIENEFEKINESFKKFRNDYKIKKNIVNITNHEFWYDEIILKKLAFIEEKINEICQQENIPFFNVILSEIIREVSFTRNNEFKRYKMNEEMLKKFNPNPFLIFENKYNRNISGLKDFKNNSKKSKVIVDNFNTVYGIPKYIENESVDMIVTSPPYGDSKTTVAYGQFSRWANEWFNFENAKNIDEKLMGGKTQKTIELNTNSIKNELNQIKLKDEKRYYEVITFLKEYENSINNISKLVKKDGKVCFVVGNRTVKGINIPLDFFTAEKFINNNFELNEIIVRNIPNKKMPKLNSPSNKIGEKTSTMNNEYIVILTKK